jgi:hypothetical protein
MSKTPPNAASNTGSNSGDILLGIHAQSNLGLLVHAFEAQPKGFGGRIRGHFRILHPGTGKYAAGIKKVIDSNSFFGSADDFIRLVSKEDGCEDCTHVLNANALWKLDTPTIYDRIVNVEFTRDENDHFRICKSCGQIYRDSSLNFCLQDGTPLSDEPAEVETVVRRQKDADGGDEAGIEYVRAAVARHPNLTIKIHPGFKHRIMKSGHTGSVWIIPRRGGVSITANGHAARRLYREMERLLGSCHREDAKGYRYFQANQPHDVEMIIDAWAAL